MPLYASVAFALFILAVAFAFRGAARRETFVAQRARKVYAAARELFSQPAPVNFADFRAATGVDAVAFYDLRRAWSAGALTLEAVQTAIAH